MRSHIFIFFAIVCIKFLAHLLSSITTTTTFLLLHLHENDKE